MKIQKLLHVCLVVDNSPQWALRNALRDICDEYIEYDWVSAREAGKNTSREIFELAQQFQPDVTFMQLQDPHVLTPEDAAGIPGLKFNWSGDVRTPTPQWYFNMGRAITCTLFTNEQDVKNLLREGIRAEYMNIGYAQNVWCPGEAKKEWPDIVFLAGNYGNTFPLSEYRRQVVDFLREKYPSNFCVYGSGWYGPNTQPLIRIDDEVDCYRGAKLAINLSHFAIDRYSSDRLLRAMGCGILVLSHAYPSISVDFSPVYRNLGLFEGGQLDIWHDFDELYQAIEFYLMNPTIAKMIGNAGYEYVSKYHNWDYRIKNEFMSIIERVK